jgi:Pathogenicity locus
MIGLEMTRKVAKSELQIIPGVGPAATGDFHLLGITRIADLKGRDPQQLYDELSRITKVKQDRCVLYVFRCAIYFASNTKHDPQKLLWWNWKD